MSYVTMSKSVELAHDKMMNGDWTTTNTGAYLKVNWLNDEVVESVINNASRVIFFREAKNKNK